VDSIKQYFKALFGNWLQQMAGAIGVALTVVSPFLDQPAARTVVLAAAVFAVLVLCPYLAWLHEHKAVEAIKRAAPRAEVFVELRGLAVFLCVKNVGSGATFYATFRTNDHRRSDSDYVRWTNTTDVKTTIARGVYCEAKLAEFRFDATRQWWHYYVTRESGPAMDNLDSHFSVPSAIPPQMARPVVLSGQVISEPDMLDGPVPYEYALEPLGPKNDHVDEPTVVRT